MLLLLTPSRGPFDMTIKGNNTIVLRDLLFGRSVALRTIEYAMDGKGLWHCTRLNSGQYSEPQD